MVNSIDLANAAWAEQEAASAFADGDISMGLYFLDASDHYAPATGPQSAKRVEALLAALSMLAERTIP